MYLFFLTELVKMKNGHKKVCPKIENEKKFVKKRCFYDLLTQLVRNDFQSENFSHVKKIRKMENFWDKKWTFFKNASVFLANSFE